MRTVALSLSKSYVASWGIWEAIREFFQNAIDKKDYKIICDPIMGTVQIQSFGGVIPASALLLGNSTKRDDSSTIGQFGEGFKLAMLIIARHPKATISIQNGHELWNPVFKYSPDFEDECLHLEITPIHTGSATAVDILVRGLTTEQVMEIDSKYLDPAKVSKAFERDGAFGFIHQGPKSLYVSGLFVCKLDTEKDNYNYSYNFNPQDITLDRDRNTAKDWEIQSVISELLIKCGKTSILSSLARQNAPDVRGYASWKAGFYGGGGNHSSGLTFKDSLSQTVADVLIKEHGKSIYVLSSTWDTRKQSTYLRLAQSAGRNPIVIPSVQYDMLGSKHPITLLETVAIDKNVTLESTLAKVHALKKHMRAKAYESLTRELEQLIINNIG